MTEAIDKAIELSKETLTYEGLYCLGQSHLAHGTSMTA